MKRSINVSLDKPKDVDISTRNPMDYEALVKTVCEEATKLVVGYILLDTFRKVTVAKAMRS